VHRLVAALAVFVFLAAGSIALADGPGYVSQGGSGTLAANGKTRYVAVPAGNWTAIERIRVPGGSVMGWAMLEGGWGIPAPTVASTGGEGLTHDGSKLVVQSSGRGARTMFAVLDARTLRILDRFTLNGNFGFDALSPDGNTLYLIQHVDSSNVNRYVVRAYVLGSHTLLPGRIADKSQAGWVMEGSAVARATGGDGRMVYTMFLRPGGYPFIHALDSVRGSAHCIGLPWHGDQAPLANARLTLADNGRTLAVRLKGGRTWLTMSTRNWRLTHAPQAGGSSWTWPLAGGGVAAALALCLGLVLLGRRRHPREAAPVPL
jgi:LPXTG-motif cell wall-anchored protein